MYLFSVHACVQGRDHVFIAPWWGAKAAWGKALWAAGSVNSVLVTFDEGFAHDWGKVGRRSRGNASEWVDDSD